MQTTQPFWGTFFDPPPLPPKTFLRWQGVFRKQMTSNRFNDISTNDFDSMIAFHGLKNMHNLRIMASPLPSWT